MENVLQVDNSKIIFLGDSAGGNLVTILQNWIIINKMKGINLQMPICSILNYPG